MDKKTFRRKRERLGLTQAGLAKRLDLKRLTILRYEAGQTPIPKVVQMALRLIEIEGKK